MAEKKTDRKQECVQVVVRCRPFSTKETRENRSNIISIETALFQIALSNPARTDQAPKNFTFDAVYDETTQQKAFYEESCYDLVEGVMEGYNGTIFAYGQTGCGKTHTMQGYSDPPELRGVIPHSFDHIFENIKGSVNTAFLVRCCYLEGENVSNLTKNYSIICHTRYPERPGQGMLSELKTMEIYNEEVRDLLANSGEKKEKLELKEDPNKGVYIKDLTQAVVADQEGINRLMEQGHKMRTVGATAMNETSSRSHSIFTIVVEINDVDEAGKDHIRVGKLNLVDLAGSERASKTGATGDRLKEGCKINLSLSALGNVISALVDGKGKHIPYRDSKLTRLLQDSLGGNTKTLMVAAISPADYNYEETLSTLRYANRAKNIKNKPKINEDPKDTMLRQYKEEIEMLRQQLAQASLEASDSSGGAGVSRSPNTANMSAPKPLSDERDSQSRTPLTVPAEDAPTEPSANGVAIETATMATSGVSEAADLTESAKMGGPAAAVVEEEEPAGGSDVVIAEGSQRSHESPKKGGEGVAEAKGGHTATLEAPPVPEVREKIVERVVVEEKVVVKEVAVEVEVESQQMAGQRQALENYSRAVEEQRNRLGQELETSVIRADVERQAREEMAKKLDALQTKVIGLSSASEDRRQVRRRSLAAAAGASKTNEGADKGGGGAGGEASPATPPGTDDPEVIIARRNAEHRRMQAKLRQKRKKETQLELERVRALEEKAEVEKEMADMVGQAEEKERRLNKSRKRLEKKLEAAREEIDDLAMEHEAEREELLDSIRNQNKELQLWEQVARQILPSKEISRIWERGEYDEDEQTWILPRIKARASYVGESCKLPLLGPVGAVTGGFDDDVNSQASGGGSSRRDRRRAGGRNSGVGEVRASGSGGAMEGGGSGRRASVGGRPGKGDTASGGEEGGGKRRRSFVGGRGGNEDRPPRRAGEGVGPREGGGGGIFNDADKPWEGFAGKETGKSRNRSVVGPGAANPRDDVSSPTREDRYKGLTPPISPAQGRMTSPYQVQSANTSARHGEQSHPRPQQSRGSVADGSDPSRRPSSHRDPERSSSAAGTWDFSGGGGRGEEVEFPSQGGGGSSRADRCPSRQGGTRTGSRAASGSRLGREQRQLHQNASPAGLGDDRSGTPEDPSHHQPTEAATTNGCTTSSFITDGCGEVAKTADAPGGAGGDRTRIKSRRRKVRAPMGGIGGAEEEPGKMAEWGDAGGGGGKKERRSKNEGMGRNDVAEGGEAEGDADSCSSILDSALWKGGRAGDERVRDGGGRGVAPSESGEEYDFEG